MSDVDRAVEVLSTADKILVFTGAGLSTESGIPDFRGPDGLWTKVDPDDFTIDRYTTSKELRIRGWRMHLEGELWGARASVAPNAGHDAVVALGHRLAGVVTQNVDGLHQLAGLDDSLVAELHGDVRNSRCLQCATQWPTTEVLSWVEEGYEDPHCPECGGLVKTNTVMFGEMLPDEAIAKASLFLAQSDAVLVLGSTVSVWPAADIVIRAANAGKPVVIVNKGETEADHLAAAKIDGAIGDVLPGLVAQLMAMG